jgi:hypothetical protein
MSFHCPKLNYVEPKSICDDKDIDTEYVDRYFLKGLREKTKKDIRNRYLKFMDYRLNKRTEMTDEQQIMDRINAKVKFEREWQSMLAKGGFYHD